MPRTEKRSIASTIAEIAFYLAPTTTESDVNDNGPGKSEIFTDTHTHTLAKRKKTGGRSPKRIARKRMFAILIRVSGIFSIQYSKNEA